MKTNNIHKVTNAEYKVWLTEKIVRKITALKLTPDVNTKQASGIIGTDTFILRVYTIRGYNYDVYVFRTDNHRKYETNYEIKQYNRETKKYAQTNVKTLETLYNYLDKLQTYNYTFVK